MYIQFNIKNLYIQEKSSIFAIDKGKDSPTHS